MSRRIRTETDNADRSRSGAPSRMRQFWQGRLRRNRGLPSPRVSTADSAPAGPVVRPAQAPMQSIAPPPSWVPPEPRSPRSVCGKPSCKRDHRQVQSGPLPLRKYPPRNYWWAIVGSWLQLGVKVPAPSGRGMGRGAFTLVTVFARSTGPAVQRPAPPGTGRQVFSSCHPK